MKTREELIRDAQDVYSTLLSMMIPALTKYGEQSKEYYLLHDTTEKAAKLLDALQANWRY